MGNVAAEKQVIALPAKAECRLAILERVLVAGREEFPYRRFVAVGGPAQAVVAKLHATGRALAKPEFAEPCGIIGFAKDGENFAEHIAIIIDAKRDARVRSDIGQRNRGIAGNRLGRRLRVGR